MQLILSHLGKPWEFAYSFPPIKSFQSRELLTGLHTTVPQAPVGTRHMRQDSHNRPSLLRAFKRL